MICCFRICEDDDGEVKELDSELCGVYVMTVGVLELAVGILKLWCDSL